ncbi:response regulator transcription factor [bacterium SCSIO 12643]|nr:response regulator transcription factor [bacterium SCSIO 12643]
MHKRKLRCGVVDDEKHARDLLAHYIQEDERLECKFKYATVFELKQNPNWQDIDILFLDVEMPGTDGISFLKEDEVNCKIVLTTAYKDYAIDGYNLDVTDYLLKPIFDDRFTKTVDKISALTTQEFKAREYDRIEKTEDEFLTLKSGKSEIKIKISRIIYISAQDEYVCFHFAEGKRLVYIRLKEVETLLQDNGFIRVHRSYIVNEQTITELQPNQITINDQVKIPIGRSYKDRLKRS